MIFQVKSKTSINTILLYVLILISTPLIFSCCSGNKTSKRKSLSIKHKKTDFFAVLKPINNQVVRHDSSFILTLAGNNAIGPDSVRVSDLEGEIEITRIDSLNFLIYIKTKLVGNQKYNIEAFYADSISEKHLLNLLVLPNTSPKTYTYKVLRSFEHDPKAYTQGLIYDNGYLYESTGRRKQSSLRRIDVGTGEVVRKKDLEPEFFGEGIALVDKEIYMITYVSHVGFVYDAVTFDLLRKFDLQTMEGWGLTTYGTELILSDGSATLYFFDPKYFILKKQIEVCDIDGHVNKLNELEYTPFGLFANIYGKSNIVLINQNTGIVKGRVELSELFPKGIPDNYDYVLNGIAYNSEKETFYVTGKQWPVIYEIKINID